MFEFRVRSWSRYDIDLWPEGQIYSNFDMSSCPAHYFFCFNIDHIWQMSVCVAYVRDSNTTLTTDLKDKFIGILTWLSVKSESNGTSMYHMVHGFCMSLIFDLNINIIFSPWICMIVLNLFLDIYRHTKFGTLVYHHKTTCCVISWPVYDLDLWPIWVAGVSLVSFSHNFHLIFVKINLKFPNIE